MPRTRLNVTVDGPLFNGVADDVIHQWLDATKKDVADIGVQDIRDRALRFDRSHRGTGHYASVINARQSGPFHDQVINDGGIVYGPWLEGVSKRNSSTRFKGYHAFRKARSRLRKLATDVAQKKLDEYISRLGGGVP